MYVEYIYGLISVLLFGLATLTHNLFLVAFLCWIGLSLFIVFIAYVTKQPKIFRKRADGSIPTLIRFLFFPFMFGVQLYNRIEKSKDSKSNRHFVHHIKDDIYLASRLSADEALTLEEQNIGAVLDVTCEFDALDWSSHFMDIDYLNIPILDHQSPTKSQLRQALNWMDSKRNQGKPVLVHCALGRGRSLFCVAAYLLAKHPELSPREVLQSITDIRSQAGLNKSQLKRLISYRESGEIKLYSPAWVIGNPVAGKGKWLKHRDEIENILGEKYNLNVVETSDDTNAQELAEQAKKAGAKIVIAAGGDGTLAEIASVLVGSDIKFGIVPLGTANALAHTLYGVGSKIIPVSTALKHIMDGDITPIDTAVCNNKTMLLVAAIGIEEQMIKKADRDAKNKLGQFAYLHGFWQALHEHEGMQLMVQFDDEPAQAIETSSLVIANAAPLTTLLAQGEGEPDYTDGLLNITWLDPSENPIEKVVDVASLLAAGFASNATDQSSTNEENANPLNEAIKTRTAKKIHIKAEKEVGYVIDGETYACDTIKISCRPGSLNVLLSKDALD